jgi:mannose-1-phosphate guanylyltransferase/mannose-6-phosphate isomerase
VQPIRAAGIGIPLENVVAEPDKRNTAGALAYITAHLLARHPGAGPDQISLAVVTADHKIGDTPRFQQTIDAALGATEAHGALVICGIPPTRPETGFGYVQADETRPSPGAHGMPLYPVRAFHEKPNRERAEDFLAAGGHYWNSGMFFWTAAAFLAELDRVRPELSDQTRRMAAALGRDDAAGAAEIFREMDDISIDYALMEHARNVLMIPGAFPWSDVGLWPALESVHPADGDGNCVRGDAVLHGASGCIVYNATDGGRMTIGVAGAEDLVVVATEDAVLVVPKDRAGDVRHLVAELKRRGAAQI